MDMVRRVRRQFRMWTSSCGNVAMVEATEASNRSRESISRSLSRRRGSICTNAWSRKSVFPLITAVVKMAQRRRRLPQGTSHRQQEEIATPARSPRPWRWRERRSNGSLYPVTG